MVHGTGSVAVSISGISGDDPTRRVKFINNIVLGGQIFCTDVDQLIVQDNVVVVRVPPNIPAGNRVPLQVQRGGDSVLITGNLLIDEDAREEATTEAVIKLSQVGGRQVTRAVVANNLCFACRGRGIQCQSCNDVALHGNMVVATGSCGQGIFLQPEAKASSVDNISVRDNDILAEASGMWVTGIQINSTDEPDRQVHHVSVIGNSVRGATEGVRFQGSTFQKTPVCALNRIDAGVTSPLEGIEHLPEKAVVAGGAATRGGGTLGLGAGRCVVGMGDPQDKVSGNVGDIFQSIDRGAGSTRMPAALYVKESDEDPKKGWTPK